MDTEPTLETFISEKEVQDAVNYSPSDLDSAMLRVASEYAHFARKAAQARRQMDFAESNVDLVRAQLDKRIRDEIAASGDKKPAESAITERIRRTKKYMEAVTRFNEATAIYDYARNVLTAIEMKRDMLTQLNKNQQREWEYSSALVASGEKDAHASLDRYLASKKAAS